MMEYLELRVSFSIRRMSEADRSSTSLSRRDSRRRLGMPASTRVPQAALHAHRQCPCPSRSARAPTIPVRHGAITNARSEEHTSELQSLMRISYAVFCLKKKNKKNQ